VAQRTKEKSAFPGFPAYVEEALNDAERLLKFAAETGVQMDPGICDKILRARAGSGAALDEKTVADLLAALTQLAARLKPVTAESLKARQDGNNARPIIRAYGLVSICLAMVIILFSTLSFITSAISNNINAGIATANDLAAKLRAQLGTPPNQTTNASAEASATLMSQPPPGQNAVDIIVELQQYAATIRSIDARTRQLNRFVFSSGTDPYFDLRTNAEAIHAKFQLPVGLTNLWTAANGRTEVFQRVRSFAQGALDNVSFCYGAVAACVLPVLYALFGTCAYLLRSLEQQEATRSFVPSSVNYYARFLIAGIGGAVVGLFNVTVTEGASVSPLAIAFLVGYAADIFFVFLDGLLQTFTRRPVSA
jgi:hypothetical protein